MAINDNYRDYFVFCKMHDAEPIPEDHWRERCVWDECTLKKRPRSVMVQVIKKPLVMS